jgi:hypothetical protein
MISGFCRLGGSLACSRDGPARMALEIVSPVILRADYAPQLAAALPPLLGSVLRNDSKRDSIAPQCFESLRAGTPLGENRENSQPRTRNIRFILANAAS